MNNQILAQLCAKNQAIIDDPWNLGKDFVMDVTAVSHKKQLSNYALELVSLYAEYKDDFFSLSFKDLSDEEQLALTRLFIESIDREIESEAIYGSDFSINNNFNCALLASLKDNNQDNKASLASIIQTNIMTYYADSLQQTLDEACEEFLNNMNEENGISYQYDRNHGDVIRTYK
jgi:hypothetical protein